MEIGTKTLAQLKKQGKKVVAHGYGLASMLNKCNKKGLSKSNSTLVVKDVNNLNSEFWVLQ